LAQIQTHPVPQLHFPPVPVLIPVPVAAIQGQHWLMPLLPPLPLFKLLK